MKKKHLFYWFMLAFLLMLSACQTRWLNTEHSIVFNTFWNSEVLYRHMQDKDPFFNAHFLDLDTGIEKQNNKTDVYFFMDCGSGGCSAGFWNLNGARFTKYGEEKPDRASCKILLDKIEDIDWKRSTIYEQEGVFSCVLTAEGRYGWVYYRSQNLSLFNSAEAEITYYIWDNE
ncbi:MAG: hypothetical protein ACOYKC_02330 [Anaerolineaceae bacterium]